jgi:hypothetical protein
VNFQTNDRVTKQPEIDIKQPESRPEFTYVKQPELEPEFKTVKQPEPDPELKNRSLHSTNPIPRG